MKSLENNPYFISLNTYFGRKLNKKKLLDDTKPF